METILDEKSYTIYQRQIMNLKYINSNSEYIYRKLLERDYKCIIELYQLLEASKVCQLLPSFYTIFTINYYI